MSTAPTRIRDLPSRTFKMSPELLDRLRAAAARDHRSMNAEVVYLCELALEVIEQRARAKEAAQRRKAS
jgi:hypothetical protein